MSDPLATNLLGLPYLAAAQAQKHVTHNEALRKLDALVQIGVADTTVTDPPGSPAEGDRYIVAATATGDWTGHENDIAAFTDGVWAFFTPSAGWLAFDAAGGALLLFDGSDWLAVGDFLGAVTQFGINATADATNRLAVGSNAVLFAAIEAGDGGDGDVRFVVNKETDGDTASLLFQSGYSGRAEVGLAGDADLVFKVSANGTDWVEAIRVDKDTGLPAILYDNATSGLTAGTVQAAIDEIVATGGGGGAVDSVFGRTGVVAAAASDYDASQVDNDSGVSGATVADALDALSAVLVGLDSDAIGNVSGISGASISDALDTFGGFVQGGKITLADDAAGSITPEFNGGIIWITGANIDGTYPAPRWGATFFDVGSSLQAEAVAASSSYATVDNNLSGVTGADGKVNVGRNTGVIRIENRLGSTQTFHYVILKGS
ncbi:MAG: DUF2793 domain-containing protein [Bauldia sp.]|nr:DUF2793 domain-containing protein [Bauldia sp.]